ncbi:MAG: hypothetical protein RLZZ227_1479 [Pseudomonadota bacterium]|jgi:hypothetical protein
MSPILRSHSTRFATTLVLCAVPLIASAQFNSNPPDYTPAADAKDLKAVLFNWTWNMGMLRGIDEHELIATLEYQGDGSIDVAGQRCSLDQYRVSTNYQDSGQRVQYSCTLPNDQSLSRIEVVNWQHAWDEDRVGAELVEGTGTATPMPDALQERLIRLWASPQGAPKAALAGANQPDPHRLPDNGASEIGATSVAWTEGKATVAFPIPGVPGATAVATLDARYMAERVVVTNGATTTEFVYGDYQDWNNPLNKVEVLYAGRMTETRDGAVVRDLTTTETETGSVYVVMPVPASVRSAMRVADIALPPVTPPDAVPAVQARAVETPKLANEKPDLSGNWSASAMNWRYGFRRCGPSQVDCSTTWNQTIDFEFEAPSRYGPNRPLYKPEYWDRVQQLDMWTNREDPVMTCQPLGIPRQGPPRRIVHSANDIIFFYGQYADGGGGYGEYRIVPTDGREHEADNALTTTYMGYTVGRWEGDTLVLDSIAFNDQTWLARGGFFHSDRMRVIERFTRQGDEILYEVTVEDPEVLVEPWVMTPRTLRLNANPNAGLLPERGNCEVYETEDITSQIRH